MWLPAFRSSYAEYGAWIILLKGLTPIPYKLVTISSGFVGYNFFWFVVLSLITRGARFGLCVTPAKAAALKLESIVRRPVGRRPRPRVGGCIAGAIRNRSGVAGSTIAAALPGLDSGTACRRSSGWVLLCRADQ